MGAEPGRALRHRDLQEWFQDPDCLSFERPLFIFF